MTRRKSCDELSRLAKKMHLQTSKMRRGLGDPREAAAIAKSRCHVLSVIHAVSAVLFNRDG